MTTPNRSSAAPAWKLEVNQRLAAHKHRKGDAPAAAPIAAPPSSGSRAAQAAARVAARYAQAPSYSQMLADEARAAVRAAEAASQAALEAQAAAESVLAGLEAATGHGPAWQPEFSQPPAPPPAPVFFDPFFVEQRPAPPQRKPPEPLDEPVQIRWEPDLPLRTPAPAARAPEPAAAQAEPSPEPWTGSGLHEVVEPTRPIHANLIEFPRELVATRRARPRIAEGPADPASRGAQLSIFEVDPGTLAIGPEAQPSAAAHEVADWARIRLDAEPEFNRAPDTAAPVAAWLPVAPAAWRLMSAMVDASLVGAVFVVLALAAALGMHHPLTLRAGELAAALALAAIFALYQGLFFALGQATPGMRYAGISLCTFDDQQPTPRQMRLRVAALLLSVLPIGLGLLWAIFDDEHLSWHDRLSGTYQRKG